MAGAHEAARTRVTITPYEDGPLLVRGPVELVDQFGQAIHTHRKTVALCRCGRSSIRPFCDGTHKKIGFKAPGGDARAPEPPGPAAGAEE